jgi:hypothetical protein
MIEIPDVKEKKIIVDPKIQCVYKLFIFTKMITIIATNKYRLGIVSK